MLLFKTALIQGRGKLEKQNLLPWVIFHLPPPPSLTPSGSVQTIYNIKSLIDTVCPSDLKGQCHEIFDFRFFHESVSPKHLSIPLRPFRNFSKILGGIRGSRCTTGVNDTGGKWKKTFKQKTFSYFVWAPLGSRVNTHINFCLQVHFKVSAA